MQDNFNFKLWINLAFISIIKNAISVSSTNGLSNNHHFYISFNTKYTGVSLSPKLLSLYDKEMTIVMQNQFEGLYYNNQGFGLTLFFNSVAENIFIPWNSITNFFDPSIGLNLKIEALEADTSKDIVEFSKIKKPYKLKKTENDLDKPLKKSKKTSKDKSKTLQNIVEFSNVVDFPK
jgi:hypothetical protein